MHIIFFTHPTFLGSQSMPRFTQMLADGMQARGHEVAIWAPQPQFFNLPAGGFGRKWLGYIDQYLVFPRQVRQRMRQCPPDTLFVFTDHALGPWVPLAAARAHVIHCHDFLAQRSARGEVPENRTSWTGRQYQTFIRNGYARGKSFVSVSEATRTDLHHFLPARPAYSEVVYNGLNQAFVQQDVAESRAAVAQQTGLDVSAGYLLHVGGNQWYKNRTGVVALYDAWRAVAPRALPLLLVGEPPHEALREARERSAFKADIHFLSGLPDQLVRTAYAGATVFLFPSLAEGFGWPIAEAMAAGCPVVTTGEAPMTEVGGDAAFYMARQPAAEGLAAWAAAGAAVIQQVVGLGPAARQAAIEAGLANARRFDADSALNRIEEIYQHILLTHQNA